MQNLLRILEAETIARNAYRSSREVDSGQSLILESYRLIIEQVPNALIMIGPSGVIVMVNAEAERIFGYPRSELLGCSIEVLLPERFRAAHPRMRTGYFDSPTERPMGAGRDLYGLRKDGREFPVEVGLKPIEPSDGAMVLASVIDITERKEAELAMRESEHRSRVLAAIVESSDDAIISVGLDGLVSSWNKSAERMFGYTAVEMIGQPVVQLAAPGYEAEITAFLDRIWRGQRVDHYETIRAHKDGQILHVSLSESPIYGPDGQLTGASKVLRDITRAKSMQEALQASQARLQELNAELLHVSRLSSMGEMAAMVAHELNQPLTAITNYMEAGASLVDRGAVSLPRLRTVFERAGEQAVRASQIMQRLRDLVMRGNSEKRSEPVSPLLREAQELALLGLKRKGIAIGLDHDLPDVWVLADKIQIQQVLLNLLRNAVEAVADQSDGTVAISTELRDDELQIGVADNGPGLPDEVQASLFQPFISTKETGMGIGLSICHTIIAAHDGRLWAEANPSGGTIFQFTLPLASP